MSFCCWTRVRKHLELRFSLFALASTTACAWLQPWFAFISFLHFISGCYHRIYYCYYYIITLRSLSFSLLDATLSPLPRVPVHQLLLLLPPGRRSFPSFSARLAYFSSNLLLLLFHPSFQPASSRANCSTGPSVLCSPSSQTPPPSSTCPLPLHELSFLLLFFFFPFQLEARPLQRLVRFSRKSVPPWSVTLWLFFVLLLYPPGFSNIIFTRHTTA